MPPAAAILASLTRAANEWWWVSGAWHALVGAFLIALALGWRPGIAGLIALLAWPLASVAVASFAFGNPFNGVVFAASAALLTAIATRAPRDRLAIAHVRDVAPALPFIALGWVYPHFVTGSTILVYVYAAPLGVVPCATLLMVSGLWLLADGRRAPSAALLIAVLTLVYGLVGTFRLRVTIDVALVLASAMVAAHGIRRRQGATVGGVRAVS